MRTELHANFQRWFGMCAMITVWALSLQAQDTKPTIAVIALKNTSGITQGEAELISDRLGVELFNTGRVGVMERNQMQEVLKEQGFQASGACSDEACLVEMGQMLGVKYLVSGSIGKLGSMYLVNIRMIDVTTAQIAQVVSEDISGGIEQVVGRLRNIANQLVSIRGVKQREPEKPAPKEEPKPEVKEEVKVEVKEEVREEVKPVELPVEEPKAEEPTVEEPKVVVADPSLVPDERAEKRKNRSGIRLQYATYPGDMTRYFKDPYGGWEESQTKSADWYDSLSENGYETEFRTNLQRIDILFAIKAGRFMTIDIGPGIMFVRENRYFSSNYSTEWREWDLFIVAPKVNVGLNMTWRINPLKINAGIMADVNFNIMTMSNDYNFGGTDFGNFDNDEFRVNVGFGPRVGLELLAGPNVGFNFDFNYRYSRITNSLFDETGYFEYRFKLPGVGLGAGLNFYF